jgi:hypothetical protein
MSATSRTAQATPGMGSLVAIFAALLAGTALIVALAYGQLTASQASIGPAAAPAPAVVHDHGWSSSSTLTTPDTYYRGWYSSSILTTPDTYSRGWSSSPVLTTPDTYSRGWGSTAPAVRDNGFDKAHAPGTATPVEERGFGSNRVRLAQ